MKHRVSDFFINTNGIFNWPIYNQVVAVILIGVLAWLWTKSQSNGLISTGVLLVILGGISNLIDRWLYGGVVDYWHMWQLAFNLADIAIMVGIGLIAATLIKQPK